MALNSMGLGVTFTARDAMSGTLNRLQRSFSGLEMSSKAAIAAIGAGFAGMAAGIGVMTVGLAGLEGAMNLASVSGRFEGGITRVGIVAQASAKNLELMRNAALDASQRSGYATADVTQGLEDIAAMGFTAQQSIAMLNPALNLAAGGGIGVAEAADAMGSAMKVFGLATDEATMNQTASKLLGIANTTALQAKDLRIALGTVGRGASAAKQNLDEMLISMGLVKNTGVDATVAASSVSSALLFMAENADKFKKIGVEVEDESGHFRNFLDVVLDVNKALENTGSDAAAVATIKDLFQRFGITAYQGISTQLKTGIYDELTGKTYKMAEAVDYLRKKQAEAAAEGLAQKNADLLLKSYDKLTERLSATWETIKITVGEGFMEVFRPALVFLVESLISVERFLRGLPKPIKIVFAALAVGASVMTITAGAALIFAGALTVLFGALLLAGPAVLAWMAGFLAVAIPLVAVAGLFTAALLAFGGGLYTVFAYNLGGATDKLVAWYEKWKLIFNSVVQFLTEGKLSGALAEEFMKADKSTQDTVVRIELFLEKMKVGFLSFWENFKATLDTNAMPALESLVSAFGRLGVALGIIDNATLTQMADVMSGDDFSKKGALAAETMAMFFVDIAEALTSIVDKVTWLIDKWDKIQRIGAWAESSISLGASAPGSSFKGGMDFWGAVSEGDTKGALSAIIGSPFDNTTKLWEMLAGGSPESMVPAVSLPTTSTTTDTPAVAAAQAAAANSEAIAGALQSTAGAAGGTPPIVLQSQLILDGQVLYESQQKYQKDNSDSSFSADSSWSE